MSWITKSNVTQNVRHYKRKLNIYVCYLYYPFASPTYCVTFDFVIQDNTHYIIKYGFTTVCVY